MRTRLRLLGALALVLASGSCKKAPVVEVEVSTGQETGSLSADPKVVRVDIVATTVDKKVTLKASAAPGGSFDLGEAPDTLPMVFELKGVGADGSVLAQGRSVDVPAGSIVTGKISLFLQRLESFARPPGHLSRTHVKGVAAIFQERYLLLTGGESASSSAGAENPQLGDFYDLLALNGAEGGKFTRNAGLVVTRGNNVLVADKDGGTWLDLSTSGASEIAAPDGAAFADVVGGRAIETPTGETWIVGATRDGAPTASILVVGSDSTLSARALSTPRSGAAVAWITNVGLVVAGGSDTGAGVEILPSSGAATPLAYMPDPTKGAALAPAQAGSALLIGGVANGAAVATRTLDLTCVSTACVAQPLDGATIDSLASRSQAFVVTGSILAVGDDASGQTRAFKVTIGNPATASEIPLREPRKGATALAAPNGTLAIMGGVLLDGKPATNVETYFPPK